MRLWASVLLRLAAVTALIILAVRAGAWLRTAFEVETLLGNDAPVAGILVVAILGYVVLTAVPFVPGAEIGMALLTVFGAAVAPLVYLATILSLLIAFTVGRLVPPRVTARALQSLHLRRAADAVERIAATAPADRAAVLFAAVEGPASVLLRHRYVALALLINLPGNVVLGGGGGLALMAGMSRAFTPAAFIVTVAIAVVPVPLAVLVTSR